MRWATLLCTWVLDIWHKIRHNAVVEVTTIELQTPEGDQGFLEANKTILEHLAVKTLLDVMGSNASPEIKLAAADKALAAIGKQKPAVLAAQHTTNIQFNAIAPHIGKALTGLGRALELAEPQNAPQMLDAEVVEDA